MKKKINPNSKKINKIVIGTPIAFQHKYEMPVNLNYPFNINLSFSNSRKVILSKVKNSFSVTYSYYNRLNNYGLSKKV